MKNLAVTWKESDGEKRGFIASDHITQKGDGTGFISVIDPDGYMHLIHHRHIRVMKDDFSAPIEQKDLF